MKRFTCAVVVALALSTAVLLAAVPQTINYQGRLTNPADEPVSDGLYLIRFRIYDLPSGGAVLWDNQYRTVSVQNGLFSYQLGDSTPLPPALLATDTARYLGVVVGTDPELVPRTKLSSVAYAYHAVTADTAAFATNTPASGWRDYGTSVRLTDSSDYVGIGTDPQSPLHVFGSTSSTSSPLTILQLHAASTGDYGEFSSFGPQISFRSEDSNPSDGDDREFARVSGGYLRSAENGVLDFSVLENGVMRKLMSLSGPSYVGGETPAGLMLNEPTSNVGVLSVRNRSANKYVAYFESTLQNEGIVRLTYTGDPADNMTFMEMKTTPAGNPDIRFRFMAGGDAYADGSWNGGGADFAEWFEKEDQIPPASLIGLNTQTGKTRVWQQGDPFIGVQSTNPAFVGNNMLKAEGTREQLERDYVVVALLGQVEVLSSDVLEADGKLTTSDGQFIGWRLATGKVYITGPCRANVCRQQDPRVRELERRITEMELMVKTFLPTKINVATSQSTNIE